MRGSLARLSNASGAADAALDDGDAVLGALRKKGFDLDELERAWAEPPASELARRMRAMAAEGEATGGGGGGGAREDPGGGLEGAAEDREAREIEGDSYGRRASNALGDDDAFGGAKEDHARRLKPSTEGPPKTSKASTYAPEPPPLSPRASPPSSPPSPGFEARFMASYARHSPMKSAARASPTSTREEEEEDETSKPAADARVRVLLPGRPIERSTKIERSDERGPRAPNANTSDAAPKPLTTRFDVDAEDDFETFYETYRGVFAAEAARRAEATDPSAEAATRERGREHPPRDPLSRDPPFDRSTVSTVSMRGGGSNALPGREVPDPENPAGVFILRGAREETDDETAAFSSSPGRNVVAAARRAAREALASARDVGRFAGATTAARRVRATTTRDGSRAKKALGDATLNEKISGAGPGGMTRREGGAAMTKSTATGTGGETFSLRASLRAAARRGVAGRTADGGGPRR